jgi:hypothetical protein
MTMHLHHPSLSLTGKKKGKVKFRNADEARKARELDASWKDLKKSWGVEEESKKRARAMAAPSLSSSYSLSIPEGRNTTSHLKSLNSGSGIAALAPAKVYTGSEMIGIGQLHKSNAIPIFRKSDAEDLAKMRR